MHNMGSIEAPISAEELLAKLQFQAATKVGRFRENYPNANCRYSACESIGGTLLFAFTTDSKEPHTRHALVQLLKDLFLLFQQSVSGLMGWSAIHDPANNRVGVMRCRQLQQA